jgi:hypothetical protein
MKYAALCSMVISTQVFEEYLVISVVKSIMNYAMSCISMDLLKKKNTFIEKNAALNCLYSTVMHSCDY